MRKQVDGIAQCNTHNRSSCTDRYSGDAPADKPGKCQCEHHSIQYRTEYQEDRPSPLENRKDKQYDYDQRDNGCGVCVTLYLPCIVDAHRRPAEIVDINGRKLSRQCIQSIVNHADKPVVASCFAGSECRFYKRQHCPASRSEDMAAPDDVIGSRIELRCPCQHASAHCQRVRHDVVLHCEAGRGNQVHIVGHYRGIHDRRRFQFCKPLIICVFHKDRQMIHDEADHFRGIRLTYLSDVFVNASVLVFQKFTQTVGRLVHAVKGRFGR